MRDGLWPRARCGAWSARLGAPRQRGARHLVRAIPGRLRRSAEARTAPAGSLLAAGSIWEQVISWCREHDVTQPRWSVIRGSEPRGFAELIRALGGVFAGSTEVLVPTSTRRWPCPPPPPPCGPRSSRPGTSWQRRRGRGTDSGERHSRRETRRRSSSPAVPIGTRAAFRVLARDPSGTVVSVGECALSGGVARLSGAYTLKAHRRRGAYTAVLRQRLATARGGGCDRRPRARPGSDLRADPRPQRLHPLRDLGQIRDPADESGGPGSRVEPSPAALMVRGRGLLQPALRGGRTGTGNCWCSAGDGALSRPFPRNVSPHRVPVWLGAGFGDAVASGPREDRAALSGGAGRGRGRLQRRRTPVTGGCPVTWSARRIRATGGTGVRERLPGDGTTRGWAPPPELGTPCWPAGPGEPVERLEIPAASVRPLRCGRRRVRLLRRTARRCRSPTAAPADWSVPRVLLATAQKRGQAQAARPRNPASRLLAEIPRAGFPGVHPARRRRPEGGRGSRSARTMNGRARRRSRRRATCGRAAARLAVRGPTSGIPAIVALPTATPVWAVARTWSRPPAEARRRSGPPCRQGRGEPATAPPFSPAAPAVPGELAGTRRRRRLGVGAVSGDAARGRRDGARAGRRRPPPCPISDRGSRCRPLPPATELCTGGNRRRAAGVGESRVPALLGAAAAHRDSPATGIGFWGLTAG